MYLPAITWGMEELIMLWIPICIDRFKNKKKIIILVLLALTWHINMIFSCVPIFLTGNSLLTYFQGYHWAYCDHDLISKVSTGLRMVNFRQSELASETRQILPIDCVYQMFFFSN